MILLQKYSTSISTRICRQIAVLGLFILHHCKYIAICSIDVIVGDFDRFNLFVLFFQIDNLTNPKFCFLTSPRKLVFAISFPFQLNFICIFSFLAYNNSFGVKAWYFYYGKCFLAVWL